MKDQTKSFANHRRTIFLVSATALLLLFFQTSYAANHVAAKIISGKVTDSATGQPLTLVSVSVQGKKIATTTDVHGAYSLNADDGDVWGSGVSHVPAVWRDTDRAWKY